MWAEADLRWKLDDLQAKIHEQVRTTQAACTWFKCSRQIGKSYLACVIALEYCLRHPGKIVRILSASLKQVNDIVNDNLLHIIKDAPPNLIHRLKSENRWAVGQSSLRLGTLEREHVDGNRGGNASLIIYEETGFVPSEDARYGIESVMGPQLLRSRGREIHISSPSEDEFHYLHTTIAKRCRDMNSIFHYTIYDSPSITPGMISQAIERCGGEDSDSFQREYLAKILRTSTRMVIPEFIEADHVREFTLPKYYEAALSIDLGGTRDKTGIVLCVWDFKEQRLLITSAVEMEHATKTEDIVKVCKHIEQRVQWRGEPARWADMAGQNQVDFVQKYDYFVRRPDKLDRDASISDLRVMFANGKVWIDPICKPLISCLNTARWDNARKDFVRTDEHGHCDILMALVYANRMINKHTNPYPGRIIDINHQQHVPYRQEPDPMQKIANALIPFNPMERSRGRLR